MRRGPAVLWPGDLREGAVEVLDLRIGGCGLADAHGRTVIGWQDDGADLVALEGVAQRRPGGVDAMVEERLLDRDQQMVGEHAQKDVRFECPSWRGRVNDGDGGCSMVFEDEQALLSFIRSRLLNHS